MGDALRWAWSGTELHDVVGSFWGSSGGGSTQGSYTARFWVRFLPMVDAIVTLWAAGIIIDLQYGFCVCVTWPDLEMCDANTTSSLSWRSAHSVNPSLLVLVSDVVSS